MDAIRVEKGIDFGHADLEMLLFYFYLKNLSDQETERVERVRREEEGRCEKVGGGGGGNNRKGADRQS